MTKRVYTDREKALAYAVLQAKNGNVKGTARELGFPIATVRDWNNAWKVDGPPPEIEDAVPEAVDSFVNKLRVVRQLAIEKVEDKIRNDEMTGKELLVALGITVDKVLLYEGKATSRTETVSELPAPNVVRELLAGFVQGVVAVAEQRSRDIIDAVEEQSDKKELPAASYREV